MADGSLKFGKLSTVRTVRNQTLACCLFLKASAEVESADHLYAVEDGVRKQYADFGGETKSQSD